MSNEFTFRRQDAELNESKALPAAQSTAVNQTAIDLGQTPAQGALLAGCELEIGAPALGATPLPNGTTLTYSVEDSADNLSFATIADAVLVQTGAAGAGAAAATKRFRLPTSVRRYVRAVATTGAGTGDCSGSEFTQKLLT